jgi:hypothetical protein
VSPEEFFMYLIIGLVITIPISVRMYRYLTRHRVKRMLRDEFDHRERGKVPLPTDSR